MRAVAITSFGPPDVLKVIDLPTPEPGPGQVRVRVEASPINPGDLGIRAGAFGPMLPEGTYVLGWDLGGTVDAVGPGVEALTPGQQVIGMSDWLRDQNGTHAEYVVLDAAALAPAPAGIPITEAATLPANTLTAAQAIDLLGLGAGGTIAVTGAAGAVGGYTLELAREHGLRAFGIAAPKDEAFVTGTGATFVPRADDPAAAIRALVPDGVDGLLDAAVIGPAALGAVRDGGVFVAASPPAMPPAERGIRVAAVSVHSDGSRLRQLVALAEQGRLTPRVARTLPFERAAEAHAAVAEGGLRGRVVLVP